jgi:hypothetical protein
MQVSVLVTSGDTLLNTTSFDIAADTDTLSGSWGTVTATTDIAPPTPVPTGRSVWIDPQELMELPMSGTAWDRLVNRANTSFGTADVSDQGNNHSRRVLAAALVGTRLNGTSNGPTLIANAKAGLYAAIGTEDNLGFPDSRWLAVGRNMPAYIIAADVLDINANSAGTDLDIYNWLADFDVIELQDDNDNDPGMTQTLREAAWLSCTNASVQEGLVATMLSVFLGDDTWLAHNWDCFKRYAGDTSATHQLEASDFGDPYQYVTPITASSRVGIQQVGAVKNSLNIDGAMLDMGRSNPVPVVPLVWESVSSTSDSIYPWVNLNGGVFAALVLHRQGQALKRAAVRLMSYAALYDPGTFASNMRWWGYDKKEDCKWILHVAYNMSLLDYPILLPVGENDLVGYTDWTHPTGI